MTKQADLSKQQAAEVWPVLRWADWGETCTTLHMWTQVVGKIRLAQAPMVNHWWQVPLYVTARGLTTSPMPDGDRTFQIDFDFIDHQLRLQASDGASHLLALRPQSVADFYAELMAALGAINIEVNISTTPCEIANPIPFEQDREHKAYDREQAQRFWRVLVQADRVLQRFRSGFVGKCSPVHFFWGSFDLAVTRFSGRPAPPHPGAPNVADSVTREAYSHEVGSAGFWPGGVGSEAAFYSYAYPEPEGFSAYKVRPEQAGYSAELKEFILPYEAVRTAEEPDQTLLQFLQTTYEAAANAAGWDRAALERPAEWK